MEVVRDVRKDNSNPLKWHISHTVFSECDSDHAMHVKRTVITNKLIQSPSVPMPHRNRSSHGQYTLYTKSIQH